MEVTTADKLQALVQTFSEPKLYLSLGAILIVLAMSNRMKTAGVSAGSIIGRLGLVVHWAALLIAAILFGVGSFVLADAGQPVNNNAMVIVGLWWAAAVLVWLVGKAVRFILTGPLPPSEQPPPIPSNYYLSAQHRRLPGPTEQNTPDA
jgi:hypothetical protein